MNFHLTCLYLASYSSPLYIVKAIFCICTLLLRMTSFLLWLISFFLSFNTPTIEESLCRTQRRQLHRFGGTRCSTVGRKRRRQRQEERGWTRQGQNKKGSVLLFRCLAKRKSGTTRRKKKRMGVWIKHTGRHVWRCSCPFSWRPWRGWLWLCWLVWFCFFLLASTSSWRHFSFRLGLFWAWWIGEDSVVVSWNNFKVQEMQKKKGI